MLSYSNLEIGFVVGNLMIPSYFQHSTGHTIDNSRYTLLPLLSTTNLSISPFPSMSY